MLGWAASACWTQVSGLSGSSAGSVAGRARGLGLLVGRAGQRVQRDLAHPQVVLGGNFLGQHQVKPGLRLAAVGDGGGADLEIAFGKGQLLVGGGFLGPHKQQAVLRGQHVKVGLADAHQQVLLGHLQLRLGRVHALQALAVQRHVGGPVQRLRHAHAGAAAGVLAVATLAIGEAHFLVHPRDAGGQVGAGQHVGLGLRGTEQVGVVLRLGAEVGGVVGAGRFVQRDQVLRGGGQRAGGGQRGQQQTNRQAGWGHGRP